MLPVGERLRDELGSPGRAHRMQSSPRSRVWRAELAGQPVVVKQLTDGPEADDRYAREVAALTLATAAEPPVAPRLLGADPDERVLVLEYLEDRPPAGDWLIGYATALARLHATGLAAADAARSGTALPAWAGPSEADVAAFTGFARAIGVLIPATAEHELADVVGDLARTQGRALLHGDPCPGNDLHTRDGVRFVDFEQASLGDGTVELAYLRIGFPTCWCVTVPAEPLLHAAEAAYRAAWHQATGEEAGEDLAGACIGWLLRGDALVQRDLRGTVDHLAVVPERDWEWGTGTARQRLVHRLAVVSRLTADDGSREGIARLTTAMRDRMMALWPALTTLPTRRPGL
ncbi:MAG TPA: hypothetical protein VKU39_09875 [Streptosporangiaceae bacterium]|nr:hypothetical protein [Streptosporangiaceae bacterium]